ncbi:MAG: hypothetical protein IID37_00880 [Planctomycetes bacterium]|nr:hypothetical protein [Planctomycetota bacterium]
MAPRVEPASPLPHRESVRETTDSIIVAFILAFVFRAFVIEAFIIPTGSMAATLYGQHGTVVCEDCEWEFSYGLADVSRNQSGPSKAVCPNCNHANRQLTITNDRHNAEAGDRILVLKWPLDLGLDFLRPQRWDVTVFKNPLNGTENYIKRLVGLPGEVLEIVDGDVYTAPTDNLPQEILDWLHLRIRAKWLRRSENNPGELRILDRQLMQTHPAMMESLSRHLRIVRKAPDAQESLWSVVYHHDYPPQDLDANQPRWQPVGDGENGWDTSSRQVRFQPTGEEAQSIKLVGKRILDRYGYNANNRVTGSHVVGDLRLHCVMMPRAGEGHITFELSKRDKTFSARIASDGTMQLFVREIGSAGSISLLAETHLGPLVADQFIEVDFRNVDHRVSLTVDGVEVLATTDEQYPYNLVELRRAKTNRETDPPRISAAGMELELRHLAVERDVYYTPAQLTGTIGPAGRGWGTAGNPILLRPGEHFMLGDNSPASQDSRYWSKVGKHLDSRGEAYQLGTVPQDQLIGRAFFVYWPNGLRTDLIPGLGNIGLIPNVGRMRWIR